MYEKVLNTIKKKEFAKDWTDEEIYEFHLYAAEIACSRSPAILAFKTAEDIAHEELLYGFDKSTRNKIGIKELKERCTTKHLMNIIHLNCRNNINSFLRKPKNKVRFNDLELNNMLDEHKELQEIIQDFKLKDDISEFLICYNEEIALSRIHSKEDESITIKYNEGPNRLEGFLNYNKLAKLYLYLFENKRLYSSEISKYLYDSDSGLPIDKNSKHYKNVLKLFKDYIKNELSGGEVYDLC